MSWFTNCITDIKQIKKAFSKEKKIGIYIHANVTLVGIILLWKISGENFYKCSPLTCNTMGTKWRLHYWIILFFGAQMMSNVNKTFDIRIMFLSQFWAMTEIKKNINITGDFKLSELWDRSCSLTPGRSNKLKYEKWPPLSKKTRRRPRRKINSAPPVIVPLECRCG